MSPRGREELFLPIEHTPRAFNFVLTVNGETVYCACLILYKSLFLDPEIARRSPGLVTKDSFCTLPQVIWLTSNEPVIESLRQHLGKCYQLICESTDDIYEEAVQILDELSEISIQKPKLKKMVENIPDLFHADLPSLLQSQYIPRCFSNHYFSLQPLFTCLEIEDVLKINYYRVVALTQNFAHFLLIFYLNSSR